MRRTLFALFTGLAVLIPGLVAAAPAQAGTPAGTNTAILADPACDNYDFGHIWKPDREIKPGECFAVDEGALFMQHDGNLVLYRNGRRPCESGTAGKSGAVAYFQVDGNLVIIHGRETIKNTRTGGNPGARLLLRSGDSGNVPRSPARLNIRTSSGDIWDICGRGFFDN